MPTGGSVIPIDINEEVKRSYLDYAMSVIVQIRPFYLFIDVYWDNRTAGRHLISSF